MEANLPSKSLLPVRPALYQAGVLAWTAVAMVAFAAISKVSFAENLAGMFALVIGTGAALLMLDIAYYDANVVAVMKPLERRSGFADPSSLSDGGGIFAMLGLLALDGARVLLR
jgi:hypothetical protein